MTPELSVVIATYNRAHLLVDLLRDLAGQSMEVERFEVVVVDDGSSSPAQAVLDELVPLPYPLTVLRQSNGGAAAARHRGILEARGGIIVILDDDMRVDADFLAHHLEAHRLGATLVQGHIAPPEGHALPLFERFHADQLERFVKNVVAGRQRLRGVDVCTGNLSFRREAYLRLGGFDAALKRSEDRELGVRFEKAGEKLVLCPDARSRHRSDHEELEFFMRRAFTYGVYDLRIARKHPDVAIADPWRFWFLVNPVSRPLLLGTVLVPHAAEKVARLAMQTALWLDGRGLERPALAGTTLAYGLEYFRGLRHESGSAARAFAGMARYLRKAHPRRPAGKRARALARLRHAVLEDYQALTRHRAKYNHDFIPFHHLSIEVVRKIGLQMMVAIRVMQCMRDAGLTLGAQVSSRLIRLIYGADVHWDAQLDPGVSLIHGLGAVISHSAKVEAGCILFHNVTLGEGVDPETREIGAPHLEKNVHVGPGATLIGPIRIGEGTKIMAGSVLTRSVPPNSLVRPSEPLVSLRPVRPAAARVVRPIRGAANDDFEVQTPAG